ncbi:MAG: septum formation protein Maf [Bacteroidales bacterium]|nr:septum formation protein Maf [Bacteroidales bacterium]
MDSFLKNYKLILASQSPRRHELMKVLGWEFEIKMANVEENFPPNYTKEDIPLYLARLKADALVDQLKENEILITADTIVWFKNRALNKPLNDEDAVQMLTALSGNTHQVYTAVQLTHVAKRFSFYAETNVTFDRLKQEEIRHYVDAYKPLDKAGAYGIQEWIGYIGIESIEGSFYNVMGLPIQMLYKELQSFVKMLPPR